MASDGLPHQRRACHVSSSQLEALEISSRLGHWMHAFESDESCFASKAVFVEMRLRRALASSAMLGISTDCYLIASFIRQALASSAMLGVPNAFRCAVACDAFERVAPLTGRFEGVLGLVWREIVRCLYSDYTPELPGAGAKVYAMRTPFFVEARRLQQMVDELRVQVIALDCT